MFTSKGPVLVEVASRITGHAHRPMGNSALGHNQVDLTVDCYANPNAFKKLVSAFPYDRNQHAMVVNLVYEGSSGKIESVDQDVLKRIKSLESIVEVILRAHEGDMLEQTSSLLNSPARIFMSHKNEKQLLEDYETIQQLNKKLFRLTPKLSNQATTLLVNMSQSSEITIKNDQEQQIGLTSNKSTLSI